MGIETALTGITLTSTDDSGGFAYGEDVVGMFQAAQTKAQELAYTLNQISSRLPSGDSNIAAIQSIITSLS
nr:hypothetical protein [Chromobacterium sp. ASV5]